MSVHLTVLFFPFSLFEREKLLTKIARDFNKIPPPPPRAHSNEFKAIMKPCGFLVNTGAKQSELQTVDFVAVAVVILNADAADSWPLLPFLLCSFFALLLFQVAFTVLHCSFHYQIKRNTKQRHTM